MLAAEIRAHRARRGIHQEAAAAELGVDRNTVSNWERGKTAGLSFANARRLARWLGITLDALDRLVDDTKEDHAAP